MSVINHLAEQDVWYETKQYVSIFEIDGKHTKADFFSYSRYLRLFNFHSFYIIRNLNVAIYTVYCTAWF